MTSTVIEMGLTMRIVLAAILGFMLSGLGPDTSRAKPNADIESATRTEVVVFEIGGCSYCTAFRDSLGARYLASTTNAAAPLRYVDLGKLAPDAFQLRGEITRVPTVVLLQDGKEVDRVEGYPVPEALFGMVRSRIGPVSE
jgi:thioredoxin-like negative regulator of GroEL